jgi:hypothetical protein
MLTLTDEEGKEAWRVPAQLTETLQRRLYQAQVLDPLCPSPYAAGISHAAK